MLYRRFVAVAVEMDRSIENEHLAFQRAPSNYAISFYEEDCTLVSFLRFTTTMTFTQINKLFD